MVEPEADEGEEDGSGSSSGSDAEGAGARAGLRRGDDHVRRLVKQYKAAAEQVGRQALACTHIAVAELARACWLSLSCSTPHLPRVMSSAQCTAPQPYRACTSAPTAPHF